MPKPITMPALSPTMTEGTVAKWLVKEGDKIRSGDVIAEVETDKATMEVEAVDEGTIGKLLIAEGTEGIAVNSVIAYLLEEGESAAGLASAPAAPKVAAPKAAAAPVAPAASAPPVAAPKAAAPAGGERVIASPLAKRMAAQAGLALTGVSGSGPNGRIIKADVEAALSGGRPAIAAAAPAATAPSRPTAPVQPGAAYVEVPTTNMRRVIARRLTEAKQQVPHFYLTLDCEIDRLLKMREELNGRGEKEGFKLSVNDFVIRASALALRKVPAANASWTDKAILQYTSVDISIAVALEAGLITPIIRHADQKGLAQISNEMKELAKRAREGKLAPEDYQGGTFSISNLGMFGIRQFDAVINPPQGAILAVGAGEQRPVVKQGALAIATVMTCTLSCDHRVVDGALGAKLLGAIKGYIEDPVTMLL